MRPRRLLFAVVLLSLAPHLGHAQSLTGAITGIVKDSQGAPLPGATVSLAGRTGAAKAVTAADGEYRFPAIEPGTYALQVEMPGFKTQQREGIGIHVGTQLAIDFLLSVASLSVSLEVTAPAPVVDVSSPGIRNGLTQEQLFGIPLDRFAAALPTVIPGINATVGAALVNAARGASSAFGGGPSGNALLIDGVDSRSPGGGTWWVTYNYNALEEIEIQGPGAPAEYGNFTGAVVNAITRSGSNAFHGLFELRYSDDKLASDNVDAETAARDPALADPLRPRQLLDFTTQVSGPIRRDRLFFFANFQRSDLDVDPSGLRSRDELLTPRFNGKLTWLPGPSDHVAAMVQIDKWSHAFAPGPVPLAGEELSYDVSWPEHAWALQWRHIFGSTTFAEAKYLGWSSHTDFVPRVNRPAHLDALTGKWTVSGGAIGREDAGRNQVNLTLSHYAAAFGHHDLKFGVEIERGRDRNRFRFVDGVFYVDYGGAPGYASGYSYDIETRNERETVYVQDAWKPSGRLTLTAGLRFDGIRGGNDQAGTVFETRSLAPRIGVAFDVGGDRRSAIRASYGHYYEAALGSYYSRALPGMSDTVFYSVPGLTEIGRIPAQLYAVDPSIDHPRTAEIVLGYDRALGADARFSVTAMERRSDNVIDAVNEDRRWLPASATSALTGEPITVYRPANDPETPPTIANVDGFRYLDPGGTVLGTVRAYRKYQALMLVLSKRLSRRWQAQASYVLSRAKGSVDNDLEGSTGNSENYLFASRALVNPDGDLTHDRRHELKLLAGYEVPRIDLTLSGYLSVVSGTRYTPFQAPAVRLESRGSRSNPTATLLDLRIEKVFRMHRGQHRLGVYADVSNVFNASPVIFTQAQVPSFSIAGIQEPIPFGSPLAVAPPRQVVLGARWSF